MVRINSKTDDSSSKVNKKKHKVKKWVILALCIVGIIILAIVADLILENYYKDNSYTKEFDNNFITGCISQGSSYPDCECILKALKQNYTFNQIKEFDKNPDSFDTKLVLDKIVGECKRK